MTSLGLARKRCGDFTLHNERRNRTKRTRGKGRERMPSVPRVLLSEGWLGNQQRRLKRGKKKDLAGKFTWSRKSKPPRSKA